ncbi:hypothetical protein HYV69_00515 [Candidatus Uhrbacteria bacterium]|nr:hypothetical protein [Candidatus Uhrbacteria bacterium]
MDDHIRVLKEYKAAKERSIKRLEETKEWSPDTKNLVGVLWAGECPVCKVDMRLNQGDYFECHSCRMQIQAISDGPNILRFKGMGKFRLNRDKMYILAVDELPGSGAWRIKRDDRI